jgi:dolichol-phosphate mannosyltransferase
MEHKNLVIIPTYNEKENIEAMIEKVFSLPVPFHMLVVDDNSPDGTATLVREAQKTHPGKLHLLERAGKLGLGTAYIEGFKFGLAHGYDYIFEMDADFSHDPCDLIRLYKACSQEGADLAIGSRYKSGVNVVNWPNGYAHPRHHRRV